MLGLVGVEQIPTYVTGTEDEGLYVHAGVICNISRMAHPPFHAKRFDIKWTVSIRKLSTKTNLL